MQISIKFFLYFLIVLCWQFSFSQEPSKPEAAKKEDSAKVYRNIETYSKKHKFTKFIHKLVFEPVAKEKIKKHSFHKIKKVTYGAFEGMIIREIKIVTLDPFGYSDTDSTKAPSSWAMKAGNSIHKKTHNFAIYNYLLIKRNKPLDSLLARESERLIRRQRFVRSVSIAPIAIAGSKDSVDVSVRVLDSWTIVPDFATSSSRSTFKLTDKNFLGTGHQFSNIYRKSLSDNRSAFSSSYTIPNIMQTFISTTLSYQVDLDNNYVKLINIERPFFSPFAKWGAGVNFDQQFRRIIQTDIDLAETTERFKYNSQDYWAGHSGKIFSGNSEEHRTTNLITTARFMNRDYVEQPSFAYDSVGFFTDEKLYLVGIGISSRKFTQDKYLFNFNVIEDVASGVIYNLTGGYQTKNNISRYYFGARFAAGKYFGFGYLSTNIEYGSFIRNSKAQEGAIVFNAIYFTNLLEQGKWKLRQFIKPELIIGTHRLAIDADRLSLNGDSGIQGLSGTSLFGTKKFLTTFQTQAYSPWNVVGFRFNPYFSYTLGMLADEHAGFKNSRLYSQFGVGFIISNDYLVFSSFQFSFSFYPSIPGADGSQFKSNSIKTGDFTLQNFELSKPIIVPYQ